MVLFGIFGIIGGKKKNSFCLFIFNLLTLMMFIVFASIGLAAFLVTKELGEANEGTIKI